MRNDVTRIAVGTVAKSVQLLENLGEQPGPAALLKPADVARLLNVAVKTVYDWGSSGVLRRCKLNGAVRFRLTDVEELIAQRMGL